MSIFTRIFGQRKPENTTTLAITGRPATFAAFSSDPWANDIFRSGVDAIARIAAKFVLQPRVTFSDGTEANADPRLARILQVAPNPYQSAYDLLYQTFATLYTTNNSFVYIHREGGQVVGLYVLHVTSAQMVEGKDGQTYAALTFANGRTSILPYRDIVHLRRHLNKGDVLGDSNDAIAAGIELANAQNAGIRQAIAQGGRIRGLVRYAGNLGPSKLEAYQKQFNETQLNGNATGVIVTDASVEFVPFVENVPTINAQDVEATKKKIYSYLGISESIVNSSFDDDAFGAFDESVIEALALQLSLELTNKIYTPAQVARGRRIEVSTSRIRFIGVANRVELIKSATPMGVISINETRDLLGLAPVEGGDKFIQSLNYADTEIINDVQTLRKYLSARKDGTLPASLLKEGDNE